MKNKFFIATTLLILSIIWLLNGQQVFATSVYDDVVRIWTEDTITLTSDNQNYTRDITDYKTFIQNLSCYNSDLATSLGGTGFAGLSLTGNESSSGTHNAFTYFYQTDDLETVPQLQWYHTPSGGYAENWTTSIGSQSQYYHRLVVTLADDDNVYCSIDSTNAEVWSFADYDNPATTDKGSHSVFFSGFDANYPTGYEGATLKTSVTNYIDAPEISYTLVDDYGTFNVINIPDENADKVHWLITYGSIDGEPQIQTWEGIDIPSKPLEFTFPHMAEKDQDIIYGTYSVRAYYTDENEDRTSNETNIVIKLSENNYNNFTGTCTDDDCTNDNSVGSSALSLDFDDCTLSSEYPFINISGCTNKIGQLLGIMNFDKLKYGGQLTGDTTGCHTLGTVGSWLNLDDSQKLICPKFSDNLRSTITPFITFGLGLIMIQFIAKRGIDQGGN